MKTWADFVPKIVMFAADCPHFTIEEEAKRAAIEFYRETRAWRSTLPVTLVAATVASQASYTVAPPEGLEMVGLPAVWLDDVEIAEARPGDVNDITPIETGTRHSVLLTSGTTIRLIPPTVTAGRVIKAQVAYTPTEAAAGIEDAKFHEHLETIKHLALSRLKYMQGKPWSDPAGARACEAEYQRRALDDGAAAGPVRRNRLRTRKQVI